MLIRTAIVAATLAALPAGAAFAQDTKPASKADARIDLMFAERDTNKDGRITQEELAEYRAKLFDGADASKDGALDSAEMAAFVRDRMAKRAAARLAAFDANKDGKLTLDEVPGRMKRMFFRADANLDGVLTVEEMQKASDRRLRRRLTFVFMRVDVDHDGKISKNEFADAGNRFLRHFDRNGDKTVTREEVAAVLATFESRRGMRRARHNRHHWGDRRGRNRMGREMRDGRRWGHDRKHRRMRDGHRSGPRRGMMRDGEHRRGMRDDDRRGMRRLTVPADNAPIRSGDDSRTQ